MLYFPTMMKQHRLTPFFAPLVIVISMLALSNCSSQKYSRAKFGSSGYSGNHTYQASNGNALASLSTDLEAGERAQPMPEQKRKVIYDANVDLTVKKPDSINQRLTLIADKYDGYSLNMGSEQAVIRVKAAHLSDAIEAIGELGKVASKNIYGEDVTEQYFDAKIRLDNAQKARTRYLELLAKAENVQAALLVEKELERLNGEIDRLQGQLKRMEHLTEYSTITIYIHEKVKPGPLGYIAMGAYFTVKWLFVRN